ncbi:MAG: glycosyltransferase [bacterium]|nr:glycosyltransferase [bacterium]
MSQQDVPSRLIVFTRYPQPGETKTRLIPALGEQGAADLQRQMTEHTMRGVRPLSTSAAMRVELRYEGGSEEEMRAWLGPALCFHPQGGGDLGMRMLRAFQDSFAAGDERVVVIGSDCPGLRTEHLREGFASLARTDLVLGPAGDGGYYLIGLRRSCSERAPALFSGLRWGSERVLPETLRIAAAAGLSIFLLDILDDVDRPEDLPIWEREISGVSGRDQGQDRKPPC